MFFSAIENVFDSRLFFEDGLGPVRVVPKIRLRRDSVQLFDPFLLAVDVKAASANARAALQGG